MTKTQRTGCECRHFAKCLPKEPVQVGVIGRRTELVLISSGQGRVRIVTPYEVPVGGV